jgi:type II secretory pathway pseudopilin PulG
MGVATAIIGSAVLGAGASLYGASKQSKAARSAAAAQTTANNQAIQLQREQRDLAGRTLQPYVDRGNEAFGLMAPHLGMGGTKTPTLAPAYANTALSTSFAGGQQGPNFQGYLSSNPDVMQEYQNNRSIQQRYTPEEFAQYHYETYGQGEGRQMPVFGQQPQPQAPAPVETGMEEYVTPEQAQEKAWEKYRTETTYGKIGDYEAGKARGEFMDMAASGGSALSGRTARGMAEVGEEAAMRNFQGYMGMLGGVADQGYGASTGIASSGQTFANNAGQLTQASGQAQAAGITGQADAFTSGLADAAGWGGWAAGQIAGQRKPPTVGGTVTGRNTYAGGTYTEGWT